DHHRVVDEDVQPAEGVDRRLDDARGAGEGGGALAAGDRRAAGGAELGDDAVGALGVGRLAGQGDTEVVDDDLGALAGEEQGMLAAHALAGAGDDGDFAGEAAGARLFSHWWAPEISDCQVRRRDRRGNAAIVGFTVSYFPRAKHG